MLLAWSSFQERRWRWRAATEDAGGGRVNKAARNERVKLLANALDRASTACVTVGVLGPIAAVLYTGS